MGYIRSNQDWYENQGISPAAAARQVRKDQLMGSVDHGYCNPHKAREADDHERRVEAQLDREGFRR